MVWLVKKKIVHHRLDLGFERVRIPIRLKFEFEVKEGILVPETLAVETLYNRQALETQYPRLNFISLERSMKRTVDFTIEAYLKECGFSGKEARRSSSRSPALPLRGTQTIIRRKNVH